MGLEGERWMLQATPTNLLEPLPKTFSQGRRTSTRCTDPSPISVDRPPPLGLSIFLPPPTLKDHIKFPWFHSHQGGQRRRGGYLGNKRKRKRGEQNFYSSPPRGQSLWPARGGRGEGKGEGKERQKFQDFATLRIEAGSSSALHIARVLRRWQGKICTSPDVQILLEKIPTSKIFLMPLKAVSHRSTM